MKEAERGKNLPWWRRHGRFLGALAAVYVLMIAALVGTGRFAAQWADATTACFVVANLLVLWWYADLTRNLSESAKRQAASAERQMDTTEQQLKVAAGQLDSAREQLALMNQEIHDSRLARLQDQKPVVFVDRVEHPDDPRNVRYVARNVGGGFALNVYYFDVTVTSGVSVGALAAGEERTMPAEINRTLCDGDAGRRCSQNRAEAVSSDSGFRRAMDSLLGQPSAQIIERLEEERPAESGALAGAEVTLRVSSEQRVADGQRASR